MPTASAQSPLLSVLTKKRDLARIEFSQKHEFAQKWLKENGLALSQIRQHSARLLTGVTLSGVLLLSSPQLTVIGNTPQTTKTVTLSQYLSILGQISSTPLTADIESQIISDMSTHYGVSAAFELDRQRIPTNAGIMGLEQHLLRFPGDSLSEHKAFIEAGMAPRRGAFGYFSEAGKSQEQIEVEERYYIVFPTFLINNWDRDWFKLKDWYKFRKFVVLNPKSGRAVIAVLGDSGPAPWTGKQFGGSPEVMASLGFLPQETKGQVIVLFLDDPGNTVPLGPLAGIL